MDSFDVVDTTVGAGVAVGLRVACAILVAVFVLKKKRVSLTT